MVLKVKHEPVIQVRELVNKFDDQTVHNGLDFDINRGEIVGIIGSSGCGKTTLFNTMLMLRKPTSGNIKIFGTDITQCTEKEANLVQQRWGVMFQSGALFTSLNILENVMFPLQQYSKLRGKALEEVALLKIILAGLEASAAFKFPADLSGGMVKRAALARAIALDPEILFLDEPTAGLDPKSAGELDDMVLYMRENLGLTFLMITHDLDTLWHVPDRVMFLGDGKVLALKPMSELVKDPHPKIQSYFTGPRSTERINKVGGSRRAKKG